MKLLILLFILTSKFSQAVEYIDQQNCIRRDKFNVYKKEKVENSENVSQATKKITSKLASFRCLQYNREPTFQEKEKIFKAMIATHLIYSHLNFSQLYKPSSLAHEPYSQHILVLKMVHQAIQIMLTHLTRHYEYLKTEDLFASLYKNWSQFNYEEVLTSNFINWFKQTYQSHLFPLPVLKRDTIDSLDKVSIYYAYPVKKIFSTSLKEAYLYTDETLKFLFIKGLYQHLIGTITGHSQEEMIGWNYNLETITDALQSDFTRKRRFFSLFSESDQRLSDDEIFIRLKWLSRVCRTLANHPFLERLGIDFLRGKSILANLSASSEHQISKTFEKKKDLISCDNFERLTLLYTWIQYVFKKAASSFNQAKSQTISAGRNQILNSFLAALPEPCFLENIYYQKFFQQDCKSDEGRVQLAHFLEFYKDES